MSDTNSPYRSTGRTTRMVMRALAKLNEGAHVAIVMGHSGEFDQVLDIIHSLYPDMKFSRCKQEVRINNQRIRLHAMN